MTIDAVSFGLERVQRSAFSSQGSRCHGAAEQTLNTEATTALEKISSPQSGGYHMGPLAHSSERARGFTAMSPLHFQKQLRLHAARRKMLTEDLDAASAAFEVGYESPSQFNRESP